MASKTVLMVAEKPSLAQSLAKLLANGPIRSHPGPSNSCQVHEYTGTFRGHKSRFKFTSVCGHVFTLDFPPKYNNWDKIDPVELFTCETMKKESTPSLRMRDFLTNEARGCDYLVLWLDCDKEGENICFEVIECAKSSMNYSSGHEQKIFRAKFSAITESEVKRAFTNLVAPDEFQSMSVDARMELDLRVGCAFTRFQTRFFQGKYGNLDSACISYGPCQTPTLGFCVDRHDAIQQFKPEPYWVLVTKLKSERGKVISVDWRRGRLFDKDSIQVFHNLIRTSDRATITNIVDSTKTKPRPLPLNTVELLKVASSGLGISPHIAMQSAERLYTQGWVSYPRTETTSYPESFDLLGTLKAQKSNSDWGPQVSRLLSEGRNVGARRGKDVGDHPPITPTMVTADKHQLSGDMWRLYEYIVKHFIATLSPDCKYTVRSITFGISSEVFTYSGKQVIDPGWTEWMSWQTVKDDEEAPDVKVGDVVSLEECRVDERQTVAPDYLTESEVITLMEAHGIGTDASIPVHLTTVVTRNYVQVQSSARRLVPTSLGVVLVHGYRRIDPDLVLPTMRSAVEEQLNLIAKGSANFTALVRHALTIFQLKFSYFVRQIAAMDELFEVSFSPLAESGKPISRCGRCRRYLKYVDTKPHRLHCKVCDETYSLPPNVMVKIYNESKCPLDDFELLIVSGPTKSHKTYVLCPYCYNNSPFPDMRKGMGCNECTHPGCRHAGPGSQSPARCPTCLRGALVLEPPGGQKWRFVCNKCPQVVKGFKDAASVVVDSGTKCPECGAAFIVVEYKNGFPNIPGDRKVYRGCMMCDPMLVTLILIDESSVRIVNDNRPPRGGGNSRGRGKPGYSRGRGGPQRGRRGAR